MHDVPHVWQGLGEASPKVFEWAYVCTLLHTAKSLLWCENIGLSPGAVHRSFLSLFFIKGTAPTTGWPYTTKSSHPDWRGPEAKPHQSRLAGAGGQASPMRDA